VRYHGGATGESVDAHTARTEIDGTPATLAGVSVLILNDVMLLQPSVVLLPGGHNELYLLVAVVISGFSTWFFGWFDRSA
jgi:hypothetical protein